MLQFNTMQCLLPLLVTLSVAILCDCNTYNVKLSTDIYVNEVADNFLSFSVDPKYLFSPNEKYTSKECICMASSLSPAYLRIAGPSTDSLVFNNSSIVLNPDPGNGVKVSPEQWLTFAAWANASDFQLVFALNPTDKYPTGMWDANSAIDMLTTADKSGLEDIVWELGYECSNQTIEEYLNDLQTLKVIVETFPHGQTEGWKVVAGDVSRCLEAESKSDFKDYITLSENILDAVLLNGHSSSKQLESMPDQDRFKLLKLLSNSETPLWLTEKLSTELTEFERAVDWLTSLGYSARNGFNVHFRELREDELYEPTLSFYMALLFKNLVGERVLNVNIEEFGETVLFAHCTSLRHQPIPGAVTLYAANMDEETARFSIKLSRLEEGGDIMQFILKSDTNGNIIVNGRPMSHEGDIRPIVKRVRPYKTLLINLPPKSFGFWVLANTNIEACFDVITNELDGKTFLEAIPVTDIDEGINFETKLVKKRTERSVIMKEPFKNFNDLTDYSDEYASFDGEIDISKGDSLDGPISDYSREELKSLVDKISRDLNFIFIKADNKKVRIKRDIKSQTKNNNGFHVQDSKESLPKRKSLKQPETIFPSIRSGLLRRLIERHNRLNTTRIQRISRLKNKPALYKNKILKRSAFKKRTKPKLVKEELNEETSQTKSNNNQDKEKNHNRTRRHVIINRSQLDSENEIDDNSEPTLYNIIKTLRKSIKDLPVKISEIDVEDVKKKSSEEKDFVAEDIELKTKLSDDNASVKVIEKSNRNGLVATILDNTHSLLKEFGDRMRKFWTAMNTVEEQH